MSPVKWTTEAPSGKDRVFYFTGPDFALENLEERRLKISRFDECNDLFELLSVDVSSPEARQKHLVWMEELTKSVGLLCFSTTWRSSLIWGHYAKNGTGMCYVFDVDKGKLQDVCYKPRRLKALGAPLGQDMTSNAFREYCAVKHSHWEYEKEKRLFVKLEDAVQKDQKHFFPWAQELDLVGVINGPKSRHGANAVRRLIGDSYFFECRPAFTSYRMVLNQAEKRWHQ